jgi:hypothetical protein
MIDRPCTYCGAKAGNSCSGYGLANGDVHDARRNGSTKASDVVELGRARALLGCSSSMSLLDGVRVAKATLTEQMKEIDELRRVVDDLSLRLEAERIGKGRE